MTLAQRYRALLAQFAQEADVPLEAVIARGHLRRLCWVRWKAWRVLRDQGLTLPQIGKIAGSSDHTTVLSGLRSLDKYPEPPAVSPSTAREFSRRYGWKAFLPPIEEFPPVEKMQPCETARDRLRNGKARKAEMFAGARSKISLELEQSPALIARVNARFLCALAREARK